MESNKKEGGIVQLVVVLGLITFICALLLGVINGVTADKIAQNAVETRDAAMAEIIPDAEFEDMNTALSADEVAAAGVTLQAAPPLRSTAFTRLPRTAKKSATAYR